MKKTVFGILIVLLIAFVGYFIIYPYDYVIRFEAGTFPGTINQSIKLWNKTAGVPGSPVVQEDLYHLEQHVQAGDSVHLYNWEITPLTVNSSKVTVRIKDQDHSWKNKLLVGALKYEEVRLLNVEDDRVMHQEVILKGAGRVRDVSTGPDGAIYVVLNNPGKVIRMSPEN